MRVVLAPDVTIRSTSPPNLSPGARLRYAQRPLRGEGPIRDWDDGMNRAQDLAQFSRWVWSARAERAV